MKNQIIFLLLLICSFAFCDEKSIKAVKTLNSPVIDGKLEEECWKTSQQGKDFYALNKNDSAKEQTFFYVLYDDEKLYLGVKCQSSNVDKLKKIAKENSRSFKYEEGENVELFLDPGKSKKSYHQLIINTNGTSLVRMVTDDPMQNGNPWEYAVNMDKDSYSVEASIPLSFLHLSPEAGNSWGLNIARTHCGDKHAEAYNRASSWTPILNGGFVQPDKFGSLELDMELSRFAYKVSATREEKGIIKIIVKNETKRNQGFVLEAELKKNNRGYRVCKKIDAYIGAETEVNLASEPLDALASVKIISLENGKTYYSGIPISFEDITPEIPPAKTNLEKFKDDVIIETGESGSLKGWNILSFYYPAGSDTSRAVPLYKNKAIVTFSTNSKYFQEGFASIRIDFPEGEFVLDKKLVYLYMEKCFNSSKMSENDCFVMDVYNDAGIGSVKIFLVDTVTNQFFLNHVYIEKPGLERITIKKEDILKQNPKIKWDNLNMLRLIFFGDFTFYISGIRITKYNEIVPIKYFDSTGYKPLGKVDITPSF